VNGNQEFVMIDGQKVILEEISDRTKRSGTDPLKRVIIVEGGTGKSVLTINLLAKLTEHGNLAAYVTKNSAPRNIYFRKLGEGEEKHSRSVTSITLRFLHR
jgi:hypothetical protein